jgi:hypothetical protein
MSDGNIGHIWQKLCQNCNTAYDSRVMGVLCTNTEGLLNNPLEQTVPLLQTEKADILRVNEILCKEETRFMVASRRRDRLLLFLGLLGKG